MSTVRLLVLGAVLRRGVSHGYAVYGDITAWYEFLPHPQYSRQHFVCILNPSQDRAEMAKQLIVEAHGLAAERARRKGAGTKGKLEHDPRLR